MHGEHPDILAKPAWEEGKAGMTQLMVMHKEDCRVDGKFIPLSSMRCSTRFMNDDGGDGFRGPKEHTAPCWSTVCGSIGLRRYG